MRRLALITLLGLFLTCASVPPRESSLQKSSPQCYSSGGGGKYCKIYGVGCSAPTRTYFLDANGKVEHSWSDTDGDCQIDKIFHSLELGDVNIGVTQERNSPTENHTRVCLSTDFELEYMCFGVVSKKGEGITDIYSMNSDQQLEELLNLTRPYCREEQGGIICPFPGLRKKGGMLLGLALTQYGGISKELLVEK